MYIYIYIYIYIYMFGVSILTLSMIRQCGIFVFLLLVHFGHMVAASPLLVFHIFTF